MSLRPLKWKRLFFQKDTNCPLKMYIHWLVEPQPISELMKNCHQIADIHYFQRPSESTCIWGKLKTLTLCTNTVKTITCKMVEQRYFMSKILQTMSMYFYVIVVWINSQLRTKKMVPVNSSSSIWETLYSLQTNARKKDMNPSPYTVIGE